MFFHGLAEVGGETTRSVTTGMTHLLRFVRPSVCETLALDGLQSIASTVVVVDSERCAIVVTEVELREIAVQMLTVAMLVRASHAALEDTEEAFNRVRVSIAAHVLARAVVYGLMVRKLLADLAIVKRAVSHETRIRRDVLFERALDARKELAGDVSGTNLAAPLNQCEHGFLVAVPTALVASRLTADVSLIGFNRLAARAHQATARNVVHCVTDAVSHEPSRLIGHAKRAMELVAADAFLAGTQQVDRREPFGEGNLGTLEYGSDSHAELFATVLALPQAGAVRLALKLVVIANRTTMRAGDPVRPTQGFKVFASFVVVAEVGCGEGGSHDCSPLIVMVCPFYGFVKYIIPNFLPNLRVEFYGDFPTM